VTKNWLTDSIRPTNDAAPITKANYTSGTYYFTTLASENVNSNLYSYVPAANPAIASVSSVFQVIQMDPLNNLMLAKSAGALKIRTIDTQLEKSTISDYLDFPWIIAQDNNIILVSGRTLNDSDVYAHTMFNLNIDNNPIPISGISNPIVAFHFDGTNYIFVASDGKVYKGTAPNALTTADTITFPVDGITGKPIPTFFANNKLYLQGTSAFYAINMTGTIDTIDEGFATNLRSTSFKVTSFIYDDVNDVLYGGTSKNGIFKVPSLAGDTVDWL
jgi:hypothetical protein